MDSDEDISCGGVRDDMYDPDEEERPNLYVMTPRDAPTKLATKLISKSGGAEVYEFAYTFVASEAKDSGRSGQQGGDAGDIDETSSDDDMPQLVDVEAHSERTDGGNTGGAGHGGVDSGHSQPSFTSALRDESVMLEEVHNMVQRGEEPPSWLAIVVLCMMLVIWRLGNSLEWALDVVHALFGQPKWFRTVMEWLFRPRNAGLVCFVVLIGSALLSEWTGWSLWGTAWAIPKMLWWVGPGLVWKLLSTWLPASLLWLFRALLWRIRWWAVILEVFVCVRRNHLADAPFPVAWWIAGGGWWAVLYTAILLGTGVVLGGTKPLVPMTTLFAQLRVVWWLFSFGWLGVLAGLLFLVGTCALQVLMIGLVLRDQSTTFSEGQGSQLAGNEEATGEVRRVLEAEDFFRVLDLDEPEHTAFSLRLDEAFRAQAKRAYRRLLVKVHPDKLPQATPCASAAFSRVKAAYEALSGDKVDDYCSSLRQWREQKQREASARRDRNEAPQSMRERHRHAAAAAVSQGAAKRAKGRRRRA